MPRRGKGEKRERHGTRPLILKVFEDPDAPSTLTTSAVVDLVSKAAGAKIPEFSVYSALRTLVKRKVLKATRVGHEKSYTYVGRAASGSVPSPPAPSSPPAASAPADVAPAMPAAESAPAVASAVGTPHKLAVGESLILEVGENHIESVTNVHGHLVVERHPRKRQASK